MAHALLQRDGVGAFFLPPTGRVALGQTVRGLVYPYHRGGHSLPREHSAMSAYTRALLCAVSRTPVTPQSSCGPGVPRQGGACNPLTRWALQLAALHRCGLIHRQVTPANILW